MQKKFRKNDENEISNHSGVQVDNADFQDDSLF
jgi:hypothetical protein